MIKIEVLNITFSWKISNIPASWFSSDQRIEIAENIFMEQVDSNNFGALI